MAQLEYKQEDGRLKSGHINRCVDLLTLNYTIVTLNINGLKASIKIYKFSDWKKGR